MIEPLIHWGTVTPASDTPLAHGRILAFRCNNGKCDDPLWSMTVRKLKPQDPPTYCLECIEMLMDGRAEVWATVERNSVATLTSVNARHVYKLDANGHRLVEKQLDVIDPGFAGHDVNDDTSSVQEGDMEDLEDRPKMVSTSLALSQASPRVFFWLLHQVRVLEDVRSYVGEERVTCLPQGSPSLSAETV
jgi:hypothetical protein